MALQSQHEPKVQMNLLGKHQIQTKQKFQSQILTQAKSSAYLSNRLQHLQKKYETNDKPVSKERFWPKLSKLEDKREQISALEDKLQNDKLKL